MADTQTQNYDLSNDILTIHSILDVFVLQNILDAKDAERLKKKLKTNRMAEDFLLKNRIVTRDTINKAYSIILKIPYIELRAMKIPSELMTLVPEQVAAKFHLIPFDKSDNILKIAISRPADLLVNYQAGLSNILKAKNLDLEIFITGETDFSECLKQYKGGSNDTLLRKGAYPVIYLRNQAIAERYLEKIPKEFIVKYRMVVFGENKKGFYLVACEDPNSPVTIKILEFIERENQIKVERFATSKDDIDFVLNIITERANSAKSAKRPINMDEAVTLGTDQKRPEENISEHPAVKDKGTLGKMLDNFLGKKVPELTIDEIPNADLVSNDEDNVVSGNTNAEPKPMEAPMQDQNLGTGISTEENREQNNSSDTSNEAIRADDNSEIKVSSEVSKDAEMTTASTAENSEVIPLTNAETSANDTIDELNNNDIGALLKEDVKTIADLERIAKEGFIPKIVAALIDFALNQRTSDIHIEPEAKITRIRCRIDGILSDAVKLPVKFNPPLVSRVKIMSKLKIDESRIPQDGRFDIVLKGKEVDVRVSTLPTVYGEKIVLRILDKSKGVLSLEDLGMTGSAIDKT
ncbi:MAG: ATPase, T2SS/T4P/T4SS family, partial [Candidatus Berkelbacteria bacterium]|nr:ATPase, T2SS/T4P/T4SS family [Candidatus Berkelbacteria bacterium]